MTLRNDKEHNVLMKPRLRILCFLRLILFRQLYKKDHFLNQLSIPYYCSIHPAERGLIAILPKDEGQMTTDERLKFLAAVSPSLFDQENQKILTRLQRQLAVVEYLSNPHAP